MMAPVIETISEKYEAKLKVYKLDADNNNSQQLTTRLQAFHIALFSKMGRKSLELLF